METQYAQAVMENCWWCYTADIPCGIIMLQHQAVFPQKTVLQLTSEDKGHILS